MTPEREKEVREIVAKALEADGATLAADEARNLPNSRGSTSSTAVRALLPLLDAAEAEAARGREAIEACVEVRRRVGDLAPHPSEDCFRAWVAGVAELARREAAKPKPRFVAVNGEVKDMRTGCVSALFFGSGQCERASAEAERLNAEVK